MRLLKCAVILARVLAMSWEGKAYKARECTHTEASAPPGAAPAGLMVVVRRTVRDTNTPLLLSIKHKPILTSISIKCHVGQGLEG